MFVSSFVKLDTKRLITFCNVHRRKVLFASRFPLQRYWSLQSRSASGEGDIRFLIFTSLTFSNLTTFVYVDPISLQNPPCFVPVVLQAVHSGSAAYSLSLITKSDHILCFQSLYYRLPKQNANQTSACPAALSSVTPTPTEIPSGLHCLLVPKTPFGLHVNQKRELVTWVITKHRDLQHVLYRKLDGQ